jgi:hypothetical protein
VHYVGSASFERPTKLAGCIAIAASDHSVRWISGGTDLAVESNLHFRKWRRLVDLEAIPELHEFSETDEWVRIGGALSLSEAERLWTNQPVSGETIPPGTYELTFHAGDYHRRLGVPLSTPPFLDLIVIRFGVADPSADYHVPLLLSPHAYCTYRGS